MLKSSRTQHLTIAEYPNAAHVHPILPMNSYVIPETENTHTDVKERDHMTAHPPLLALRLRPPPTPPIVPAGVPSSSA